MTPLALTTTRRRFLAGTAALLAASRLGRVAMAAAEHPVYLAERAAVRALVPDAATTHTAVKDGPWEAATFGGTLPGDGSRVLIPMGRSVTLGGTTARLKTLHVTGSLTLEPAKSCRLVVDTAVVGFCDSGGACGSFTSHPSPAVTHTVLFADFGPIDLAADPGQFGRGLICHGRFDVQGAAVRPWELADILHDDDKHWATESYWPAGLKLRTIPPPESVLARNVIFKSESTAIGRRGHIMFMHTDDVLFDFALLEDLGRTNKAVLIHNTDNPRGRYPKHFHRCGDQPIYSQGIVVRNSPGWGSVNHSSNVVEKDAICLGHVGAGFVAEAGNEMGAYEHCLAAKVQDVVIKTGGRLAMQDFAFNGFGIFCMGGLVEIKNCAAVDQRDFGIWNEFTGLVEAGLGECLIETRHIPDYLTLTNNVVKTTLRVNQVPLRNVSDNICINCGGGYGPFKPNPAGSELLRSYMRGFKEVGCETGISFEFQIGGTYENFELIGNGKGRGIDHEVSYGQNEVLRDFRIAGYPLGFRVPISGKTVMENGRFEGNALDLDFTRAQQLNDRRIIITNCGKFTYKLGPALTPLHISQVAPYAYFSYETILVGGKQLYWPEQHPDHVPFVAGGPFPCPTEFVGKTNRQLFADYGLCVLGALAPADAVSDGQGLLGTPATVPLAQYEKLILQSPLRAPVGPYTLKWVKPGGKVVTDPVPATLHAGWNAVTRVIGGVKRTFFVWGL